MGLKDSLGWESLQQSGYTAYEQVASFAKEQAQGLKGWMYSGLQSATAGLQKAAVEAKETAKDTIRPLTAPLSDSWKWAGALRSEQLEQWPFSYRLNFLATVVLLAGFTASGIRPRLRRVVFLGGPGALLLTPELSPFNRSK